MIAAARFWVDDKSSPGKVKRGQERISQKSELRREKFALLNSLF
jgi:hypothetical protein